MIILIGCNKGGAGKTTTATNLAVGLAIKGKDVCIVDADPQRSAARWYQDREEQKLQPRLTLVEKLDNISTTLESLSNKFDYVVVDVAGRNSRELITGGAVADIIVAPHQASQLDMDTMQELEFQTSRLKSMNQDLKVLIYHAMASTNTLVKETERSEFLDFVSDLDAFIALDSIGYFRKVYRDVIPNGASVFETGNINAINEITSLIDEVLSHGH